jgi:hypothetical protein
MPLKMVMGTHWMSRDVPVPRVAELESILFDPAEDSKEVESQRFRIRE